MHRAGVRRRDPAVPAARVLPIRGCGRWDASGALPPCPTCSGSKESQGAIGAAAGKAAPKPIAPKPTQARRWSGATKPQSEASTTSRQTRDRRPRSPRVCRRRGQRRPACSHDHGECRSGTSLRHASSRRPGGGDTLRVSGITRCSGLRSSALALTGPDPALLAGLISLDGGGPVRPCRHRLDRITELAA